MLSLQGHREKAKLSAANKGKQEERNRREKGEKRRGVEEKKNQETR